MSKLKIMAILVSIPVWSHAQSLTFQTDLAGMLEYNAGKIISLAEAMPADAYSWSPSDDVRSGSGVIAHIVGANYYFASMLGSPAEGVDPRSFKDLQKEAAVTSLRESFDYLIEVSGNISDEALEDMVKSPDGRDITKRMVLLIALSHATEHMGQLIAYARSNGIVPPWSQG